MGLNEVAIGISPPGFAIELARSRLHPAWLSRTVTLGEMYQPDEAQAAGFLDRVVSAELMDEALAETAAALRQLHRPSHATAKMRLRRSAIDAMRAAIESELTISAYEASSRERTAVLLPGG
jgi:enoyl-CoA hydratase